MNRRQRVLSACLAVVALVFAQYAVSAHWCAVQAAPASAQAAAGHDCCPQADPDAGSNGNVCQQHCLYGEASFDNAQPAPAAFDAAGPVLRVQVPVTAALDGSVALLRLAATPAQPPPAILFGVLRI